eukprot:jgi/Chrpa1/15030/Chrysochromulina_OHIO_Genome00003396-RA
MAPSRPIASAIAMAPSGPMLLRLSDNSVTTALTFSASAIAMAPSGPMLLLLSHNSVTTALTVSASAIAMAPSAPIWFRPRSRVVITALTFSASVITLAPSSPMLLAPSLSSVRTALTFSASAIAMAPSGPMLLVLRFSLVRTALTFSASTIAMAPSGPMLLLQRFSSVRTALTFSASAIALAPSSPILFQLNSRLVRTSLTFSASAIALAPSAPMSLLSRLRKVKTALTFSASAIALAPSTPILLYSRRRQVRTTALTFSASAIAMAPSSPMELLNKSRLVRTGMTAKAPATSAAPVAPRSFQLKSSGQRRASTEHTCGMILLEGQVGRLQVERIGLQQAQQRQAAAPHALAHDIERLTQLDGQRIVRLAQLSVVGRVKIGPAHARRREVLGSESVGSGAVLKLDLVFTIAIAGFADLATPACPHRRRKHLILFDDPPACHRLAERPSHAPLDNDVLLGLVEWPQLERQKVLLKARPVEPIGARRDQQHVSLWREHLRHVPLDGRAHSAALVHAIEQQQRASRAHRAAQHAVHICVGAVCVDPVPRGGKGVSMLLEEQQPLQLLHAHEHGDKPSIRVLKHVCHELRDQARLACCRRAGEQHAPTLLGDALFASTTVEGEQRGRKGIHLAKALLALTRGDGEGHALLTHVESLARESVDDCGM